MLSPTLGLSARDTRSDWIRLRTLILLRWLAIGGQLLAITLAHRRYGLDLPLGLCYLVVGAAIVANLIAVFVFPENKRLTELEALLTLLFDVAQLALLLYLTGGLTNPFALLVVAPVTISATILTLRSTVLLGVTAIGLITLLTFFHLPLRLRSGEVLMVPPLIEFGTWLAIVIGIGFLGIYSRRVSVEMRSMSEALLATQMALAREQKLTDLGGVVAAAAHELGTPLATIKLVSSEMISELGDRPELRDDAELIRSQADRCRDILRSMGRAGKDDSHLRHAPLGTVVREAAEPHAARGKALHFQTRGPEDDGRQPLVRRAPEIIHGLRNLVQNAVDFARGEVWVDAEWSETEITVRIADDGDGFPPQVIGRIGDPFMRSRRPAPDSRRPEYEGMGLGLFIAKTLLERTGARLRFYNGADPFLTAAERHDRSGAVVEVVWPRARISPPRPEALGENRPITS
ncbi:MAG: ActS/PrrB/RegB family redox-sensitive histidine kinase [Rhodobacteraceae bacterium]|nr:ActS/PrrB/RegB family redox-sensitive histidine kinase [Paracoccaceae bacterium]